MRLAGAGRSGAGLLVAALATAPVAAHDLWLEPSSFAPRSGDGVAVQLRLGEGFVGQSLPRDGAGTARLAVLGPSGERPLPGIEGAAPAAVLRPLEPGAHWLVYESRPRRLTLAAERFAGYLEAEGLDAVLRQRATDGATGEPGRELYRRCAKSLLAVGGATDGWWSTVGCRLELVLDSDPGGAAATGVLVLRLLFDGRPLAGALVTALPRLGAAAPRPARTDRAGRVTFAIARSGVWLFRTVHMEPAGGAAAGEADWQSWWASLTAHLGDR